MAKLKLSPSKLKACREKELLTQNDLAELSSINLYTLRQWEQGHVTDPGASQMLRVANALGISILDLMEDE